MTLSPDHSAVVSGQLNGAIRWSDFEASVLPATARALEAAGAVSGWDNGDGQGHSCKNPDGSESPPGDGHIGVCEIEDTPLFPGADLELFDGQGAYHPDPAHHQPDSFSFGFAFTAVAAGF